DIVAINKSINRLNWCDRRARPCGSWHRTTPSIRTAGGLRSSGAPWATHSSRRSSHAAPAASVAICGGLRSCTRISKSILCRGYHSQHGHYACAKESYVLREDQFEARLRLCKSFSGSVQEYILSLLRL